MARTACSPQTAGETLQAVCAGQCSTPAMLAPQMPGLCVSMQDVLAAVETLYDDELQPYGRILRKRLQERGSGNGCFDADIGIKSIQQICEACPLLHVQTEEGNEWSATLKGRRSCFVDVYSPEDHYSSELWQQMAAYFNSLQDSVVILPGGRYSCAQALMACRLPFLEGCSLGQVSHIVQLAISQKKILGYSRGAVVPYKHSESMVKDRCAERQRPCMSSSRRSKRLATWENVRSGMQQILEPCVANSDAIPLSNLKRLFRFKFRQELSETALGHSKLSELLQDEHLSDLCGVQLKGNGYVVVPKMHKIGDAPSAPKHNGEVTGEVAQKQREIEGNKDEHVVQLPAECVARPDDKSQQEKHGKEDYEYVVQNTFITVVPVSSAQSLSHKRTRSLPMDMGSPTKPALESKCQALCFLTPPLSQGLLSPVSSSGSTVSPASAMSETELSVLAIANSSDTGCSSSDTLSSSGMVIEDDMDCSEDSSPAPGFEEAANGLPESEVSLPASLENLCATGAFWGSLPKSGTARGDTPTRRNFQSLVPSAELFLESASPPSQSKTARVSGQCGDQLRSTRTKRRQQQRGKFLTTTCAAERVSHSARPL